MSRQRISPQDAIIILKGAAEYAALTVPHFAHLPVRDKNREIEKIVANHYDDFARLLRIEMKARGIMAWRLT